MTMVHRDDVAAGILLALDKGRPGESYVLTGEALRMRELLERIAKAADRRPPRFTMPTWLIRASAPLGPVMGPLMGFPPNFRELVQTSAGVTFWARADKAEAEFGWSTRPLDEGLRELAAALRTD
jgi:dihydroflavonol-4-reductase